MDLENLRKPEGRNYIKCILALHYVKTATFPFVEEVMEECRKDLKQKCALDKLVLCVTANGEEDLVFNRDDGARFKHTCSSSPKFGGGCRQILLNIAGVSVKGKQKLFEMVKGTEPKEWLKTTFNIASIFLKPWMRSNITRMEDCDISALIRLIITCKTFENQLSIDTFERVRKVKSTRNIVMHSSSIEITKPEFLEHLEIITELLNAEEFKERIEMKQALEKVEQLKNGDFNVETTETFTLIRDTMDLLWNETKYRQENIQTLATGFVECFKFMQNAVCNYLPSPSEEVLKQKKLDEKLKKEIAELQMKRTDEENAIESYNAELDEINERIEKLNESLTKKFVNRVGATVGGLFAIAAAPATLGMSLAAYAGVVYTAREHILTYDLTTLDGCYAARSDAERDISELSDSMMRLDTLISELQNKLTKQ